MNCNKCGHMLPDDSEFCQYCGSKVEKVAEEQEFKTKESEKSINEDVVVSHENLVITKAKPQNIENSNRIKKAYKKSKFVSFCNISNIVLSSISILSIIIAMVVQDPQKALEENYDPSIVYFLLLCVLGCYLGFAINSLIKHKYKLISWFSSVLAVCAILAGAEYSVFSYDYYDEVYEKWIYYINYDIVDICNIFWVCCIVIICILAILFVFRAIIISIKDKWHSSIRYREKCYKRISKTHSYLERGIITEAEYEETRKQIISKIRN